MYRPIQPNILRMHLKKLSSLQLYLLPVIILFCSLSLNAQTDSLQGKSYEELIGLYDAIFYKNTSQARTYAIAAYELAKKEDKKAEMALAKYNVARAKYNLLKYEASMEDLEEVIRIATELNDNVLLYKSYSLKGNILCDLNRDSEGLNQYIKAREYAKITQDPVHLSKIAVNIALIKKFHKDYEEAINVLLENLKFIEKNGSEDEKKLTSKRIILSQLTDTYLRIEQPHKADYYNNLVLQQCSEKENPTVYHYSLLNTGIIEYQNKNFIKSIELCKKVESYYIKANKQANLATPYYYIGRNSFQLKRFEQAVEYLEKAIEISDKFNIDFPEKEKAHEYLHLSYIEIGDKEKIAENFKKYKELGKKNDSLAMSLNNRIHKEHDIIPLQEEIESLDKNTKYLYTASAIMLALLVGFYLWYRRKQKRNKKRFQELLVTIKKLEKEKNETIEKETSTSITDENVLQILKDLEIFEEKKLYLKQDCTLGNVAKKLKTNTTYLSNVINTYKEKSFKSYLSELRINDALIQLKNDSKLRSYTIKAIAEEFGFKRAETFSKAFKAQTNMLPSYYIKSLEKQKVT